MKAGEFETCESDNMRKSCASNVAPREELNPSDLRPFRHPWRVRRGWANAELQAASRGCPCHSPLPALGSVQFQVHDDCQRGLVHRRGCDKHHHDGTCEWERDRLG